jgi:GxxExxY protein
VAVHIEPRREPPPELDAIAREIIGAAIEVHRVLGPGFLESIYEDALCLELSSRRIPFARQVLVEVRYKGQSVGQSRPDLIVAEQVIVELKAVSQLLPIHVAQAISYLKALGQPLALIINFQVPVLPAGIRRVVFWG